ncbi:Probable prolyl 4-hydroxylase 11 [Striga hermonthica]|uniref:Probable prolyl 4-hydroxylase 11 n=1 Tax=Striga hermonthica TaxID=68872 RepID=A0A9N7NIU3_STRHE|nr:Probable prolyl 4-hydroxylase 11 [Striga hermonthica]
MMGGSKFEVSKFDGHGNFRLWQTMIGKICRNGRPRRFKVIWAEEEGTDLGQHVNIFNQVVTDLASLEVKIEDEDKAMILLCSLPPSYEHMVTILTYGKETIKTEEVTSALLAHNQRKQNSGESSSQSDNLYVKGNQDRGKRENEESDCSDGDVLSISTAQYDDAWILDSGCSYHITPNREWFATYKPGNSGSVFLGDDRCCGIVGIGDVKIKINGFIPKADEDRETIKIVKGALTVMKGTITTGNIYNLLGSTAVGGVHAVESAVLDKKESSSSAPDDVDHDVSGPTDVPESYKLAWDRVRRTNIQAPSSSSNVLKTPAKKDLNTTLDKQQEPTHSRSTEQSTDHTYSQMEKSIDQSQEETESPKAVAASDLQLLRFSDWERRKLILIFEKIFFEGFCIQKESKEVVALQKNVAKLVRQTNWRHFVSAPYIP